MNCYFRLSTKEEKNFAVEKYMLRLLPVCIILFFLELAVFIVFAGNFNYVQLSFTVAKLTLLICFSCRYYTDNICIQLCG